MSSETITSLITDDLRESIQKNLPALVGETLMSLLQKAEQTAATNVTLTERNQDLEKHNRQLSDRNAELLSKEAEVLRRETDVKGREEAVQAREQKMELLELRVTHANEKVDLMKEIFRIPFQNRVLREGLLVKESGSIPVGPAVAPTTYGGMPQAATGYTNTERREEHTQEEG